MRKLRVLLVMEQCNPEWPSVPLLGYHFFREISKRADVTLCTHGRNKTNLEKVRTNQSIVYFPESKLTSLYYKTVVRLSEIKGVIWPIAHAISYPIYSEFNRAVYRQFKQPVIEGKYDLVHAMTPIIPRYPYKIINACTHTPFLLGPVNGGLPFPKGFEDVAKKEYTQLNFLRSLCYLLPGYEHTYTHADRILAGSTYTMEMLKEMFKLPHNRIQLFFENGLLDSFYTFKPDRKHREGPIELLFVGRLVPYKGADLIIEAMSRLSPQLLEKVKLRIIGDGTERHSLEELVQSKKLTDKVIFSGWLKNEQLAGCYESADVFCFPSLREFGGAVVLEAMAAGLPSIIVDNGGISEYSTQETAFKIAPTSKEDVIEGTKNAIATLATDSELRNKMGEAAFEKAKEFEWGRKADKIVEIYHSLCSN